MFGARARQSVVRADERISAFLELESEIRFARTAQNQRDGSEASVRTRFTAVHRLARVHTVCGETVGRCGTSARGSVGYRAPPIIGSEIANV